MKKDQLIQNIEHLGFSDKESRIYIALLELGQGSLSEVSRTAQLKWTITHNLVKNLVQKGLLSEVSLGNRKMYSAVHPRRLLQIAQLHKQYAEQAQSDLIALRERQTRRPDVQMYTGENAIKQAYIEIQDELAQGKELLWTSDMQAVLIHVPEIVDEHLKIMRRKGVRRTRELLVLNDAGKEYVSRMVKLGGKAHIRFLPLSLKIHDTEEAIIGDKLYHFIFGEEPSVVIWDHPDVIETRRAIFNYFWETTG